MLKTPTYSSPWLPLLFLGLDFALGAIDPTAPFPAPCSVEGVWSYTTRGSPAAVVAQGLSLHQQQTFFVAKAPSGLWQGWEYATINPDLTVSLSGNASASFSLRSACGPPLSLHSYSILAFFRTFLQLELNWSTASC